LFTLFEVYGGTFLMLEQRTLKETSPEIELIHFHECESYARKGRVKRSLWINFFDVLFATTGLLITSVPMLFIVIAIKIESRGPAFFIQERLGQYKKPFWLIKFRTMVQDAEKNGPMWAEVNDNRVTPVGKFLRKTRLDELPQFFNILKGDLSFVGPRPVVRSSAELLSQYSVHYNKRFIMKPGITGWSQIYWSHRPFSEAQLEKLPYDLRYLHGLSVKDYFKIIALTIKTMLRGNGV
jgi:lipopolysaccharide/colanic/teichoic acid biosynthesis glycosyltransferase